MSMEQVFLGILPALLLMGRVWDKGKIVWDEFEKFLKTQVGFGYDFVLIYPTLIIYNFK